MATKILVIGGGPGGYVAAIRAAQLGAEVTLVEKDTLGGTCLNRGCIPTKALLHCSEIFEDVSNASRFGVNANAELDWDEVQSYCSTSVNKLNSGVKSLMKANKISVVYGTARFINKKEVLVGDKILKPDKIIIATGSEPSIPPIPGLAKTDNCIDSTKCLKLDRVPESLAIIGGGVIGVELGCAYARFGSKITIIEMLPQILPGIDSEMSALIRNSLENSGISIYSGSKVLGIEKQGDVASVCISAPDGETKIYADKVLVCTGRRPVTGSLGLEIAGVATDKRGFITVNDRAETSADDIFAIGDCTGKIMLAHVASVMGETAAENAMGYNHKYDLSACPSSIYIKPEYASVGMTEEAAKQSGIDYTIGRFPISANGKSLVMGCDSGIIKIIASKKYGEILGAHIFAPHASDLIQQICLGIKLEATLDEFEGTIHGHPTVSESLREACLSAQKRAIHIKN